ncbi:hypothetical protein CEH05_19630 [Halobacillus halophilus]|nr:hypothetical protein CEH05_19630 [Halobacillus halophilus]
MIAKGRKGTAKTTRLKAEAPWLAAYELEVQGSSTKIATSCGNVERPCVVQGHGKRAVPWSPFSIQYLEIESSTIRPVRIIRLTRILDISG